MLNYNLKINEKRGTVTLVLLNTRVYSCKYLLERFPEKNYFGEATIHCEWAELNELVDKIETMLSVDRDYLIENPIGTINYPVFSFAKDEAGNHIEKTYKVKLSNFSRANSKNFFFTDLTGKTAISDEDMIRNCVWGIEVEFGAYGDERKLSAVFHRAIRLEEIETYAKAENSAWDNIMSTEETTEEVDMETEF